MTRIAGTQGTVGNEGSAVHVAGPMHTQATGSRRSDAATAANIQRRSPQALLHPRARTPHAVVRDAAFANGRPLGSRGCPGADIRRWPCEHASDRRAPRVAEAAVHVRAQAHDDRPPARGRHFPGDDERCYQGHDRSFGARACARQAPYRSTAHGARRRQTQWPAKVSAFWASPFVGRHRARDDHGRSSAHRTRCSSACLWRHSRSLPRPGSGRTARRPSRRSCSR